MAIEIGTTLSHYRLLECLGAGGMGEVYRALDTRLNRHVAVKVLPADLTADAERRLRFQREAQAAAALAHPNIGVIHEIGEHEGLPFLVMELIPGRTLREVIGNRPVPLREWFRFAIPIADGLTHAHRHGIVHRDLKPDNVMVTDEHQVKILDFGLAKLLEPEGLAAGPARDLHSRLNTISRELTRAGKVFGTVAYMSPEQARGDSVDHRSDLFSFGIVLYQMATGTLPFRGDSQVETLHSILKEEPPPLSEVTGEVPPEADRVVRKALEKEPERRYQHADEIATDLRNLQRDLDSGRVTAPTRVAAGAHGRRRLPTAAIVVAATAILGTASLLLWRGRTGPETAPGTAGERTVGVVGFETLGDPEDTGNLNRMLMSLITTDLVESGGLEVVSVSRILSALRELQKDVGGSFDSSIAAEVARRAGIDSMLVGQIGADGTGLFLSAELVDVHRGTALASFTKTVGSHADLFALAGAIAEEVRGRLGVRPDATPAAAFDLARSLTSSPEAYREYTAGQLALHHFDWPEAIDRFRRALEEDPTFALAYYRLAFVQSWSGQEEETIETLRKGLPHIGRLPERWQVVYRASLDLEEGRHDAAYGALSGLVRESTDIPEAYYDLGEIVTHLSRFQDVRKARELFEKTLALDPSFKVVFYHLVESYIAGDDLRAAEDLIARYRLEDSADPSVLDAEVAILTARGNYREAITRARDLVAGGRYDLWTGLSDPLLLAGEWGEALAVADDAIRQRRGYQQGMGYERRGLARVGRGQLREALDDLELAAARTEDPEHATTMAIFHMVRAGILAAAGDSRGAEAAAGAAVRADPYFAPSYYVRGRVLLVAGKREEFEATLADLRRAAAGSESPVTDYVIHLAEAEGSLAEGDLRGAERALQKAAAFPPEHRHREGEFLLLARVKAAAGDRKGAIAAYREVLAPQTWSSVDFLVEKTLALYRVAVMEEETGDLEAAREHYREFLERWGDADMPVPEVAEAKARLARLESR